MAGSARARTVVQKFGGTSVADVDRMRRCARWVLAARARGDRVVVVVSAMGKTTDRLVELADEAWREAPAALGDAPPRRELDMLLSTGEQVSIAVMAMVLASEGQPAVSVTGRQIGLTTDGAHTRARISSIDAGAIAKQLDAGRVVVVAGFQGVTPAGEITTLGRGGSDTTAVAIAAAVGADVCEIYTDVDGVYTTDPRAVPSARRLAWIQSEAMLEMASLGAGVLHPRAVQFGAKFGVPIRVRHSQRESAGTLISREHPEMETIEVAGVALKENLGRVTIERVPDRPGVVASLFAALAEAGIVVDDIIQTVVHHGGAGVDPEAAASGGNDPGGGASGRGASGGGASGGGASGGGASGGGGGERSATVAFTVEHSDLSDIRPVLDEGLARAGGGSATIEVGFGKVSVVGVGVRSHASIAATMFGALAEAGVNIANITTSEIRVSAIIDKAQGSAALRAVHDAFGLGDEPAGAAVGPGPVDSPS